MSRADDSYCGTTFTVISLYTYINMIDMPDVPIIKIGLHDVIFKNEGIRVGCEFISTKTVGEIYDRLCPKTKL